MPTKTMSTLFEAALDYARMGWPVFPIRPRGKTPLTTHGLKDASTDPKVICGWWNKWPNANIGIVTGKISGLAVLDIDSKSGGLDNFDLLQHEHGGISTLLVQTGGGGYHYYMKFPETGFKNSASDIASGIDTRGTGGYVVAPPSNHASGNSCEWVDNDPGEVELAEVPGWILEKLKSRKKENPSRNGNGHGKIQKGERNSSLTSFAGKLRALAFDEPEILAKVLDENQKRCDPVLEESEVKKLVHSVCQYPRGRSLTDAGNAERLVDRHGENLLYCHKWGKWLIWDGAVWKIDASDRIKKYAIETARGIYEEAQSVKDTETQKRLSRHAIASQSKSRLESMLSLAQHMLPIEPEALDTNLWLLNCQNGTIDLRTGKLLQHTRNHHITKICQADFDPNAECPTWLSFLDRIMDGDTELISFLQRVVGYSLTGSTEEQGLFILHGTGRNGKTTFLEVFSTLLADYARKAEMRSFMSKKGEGANNDIAALCGARFVTAVEAGRGKILDEPLIKEITGGDRITARFLFQEHFTFSPNFKIFLGVNILPEIRGSDEGIWRRINLIPFDVTIPLEEVDKKLPIKLRKELPGILAWAVQGCRTWKELGLLPPEIVFKATKGYRDEMDLLVNFIDEMCITVGENGPIESENVTENRGIFVTVEQIYQCFLHWLRKRNQDTLTKKAFGHMMSERGFRSTQKRVNGENKRVYKGIAIRVQDEFEYH